MWTFCHPGKVTSRWDRGSLLQPHCTLLTEQRRDCGGWVALLLGGIEETGFADEMNKTSLWEDWCSLPDFVIWPLCGGRNLYGNQHYCSQFVLNAHLKCFTSSAQQRAPPVCPSQFSFCSHGGSVALLRQWKTTFLQSGFWDWGENRL